MSKSAFIPTLKIKLKNRTKPSHLITHVQPRGCRKCYWKFTLSFIQSTEHPDQAGTTSQGLSPGPSQTPYILGNLDLLRLQSISFLLCRGEQYLRHRAVVTESQRHYWGRYSTLLKQFLAHFLVQTLPYCNHQLAAPQQLIYMPGSVLKSSPIHTSNKSSLERARGQQPPPFIGRIHRHACNPNRARQQDKDF